MPEVKADLSLSRPGPGEGRAAGPLVGFLARVRPKVEELLRAYRLPAATTEEIVAATLQTLVWKWEMVRDREAWLLAVLDRKCRLAAADLETTGPHGESRQAQAPGANPPGVNPT